MNNLNSMKWIFLAITSIAVFTLLLAPRTSLATPLEKGIYITQPTMESSRTIKKIIRQAKEVGINTFIVDYQRANRRYQDNIKLLSENKIKYVARIVVFPDGGTAAQVHSQAYWEKKYKLVEQALALGADEIQLDYIRYKASQRQSSQNAKDINAVIGWFKEQLTAKDIPLQIDVFGVTSFGEVKAIGQNVKLFANNVDAICPMVYPSHYYPYAQHSRQPYKTITKSLDALKNQFNGKPPFKIYAYIEVSNPRYHYYGKAKVKYIHEQIRAVQDANIDGWYAWSPSNKYYSLFAAMKQYDIK